MIVFRKCPTCIAFAMFGEEYSTITVFFFPVVPQGKARIRVQMSAAHSRADLEFAVAAFTQAGRELGLIA